MNKKKEYGFPEQTKKLFRIEWKSLDEILQDAKKQLKQKNRK